MPSLQLNVKSDSSSESKTESLKDAKNGSKNAEKKRFDEKRKKPKHVDKVIFKFSHLILIVILEEIEAAEEERRREDARREGIWLLMKPKISFYSS